MMQFKEESSYSYIYVDAENQVHLMVPISAGGQIAIDNTCQSTAEINKFFRPGPASALASVQKYIKDIQSDISLLNDFPGNGANTAQIHAIWQEKMRRLQQLQQYERLLQDPAVINSSYAHGYPEPIKELLKRKHSGNFFPVALSTAREDSATNLAEPVFKVTRAGVMGGHATSGLGHVLRTTNFPQPGQNKDKSKTAVTQKASVIIDESNIALVNEIVGSRGTFGLKDIKELCKKIDDAAKKRGVTISSYETLLGCFADIESFKNASEAERITAWFTGDLMVADNDQVSAPEVVKAILNRAHLALENKERYEVTSVFEPYIPKDGDQEKFSIAVQFFLALVNAHCYSENFFEPGLSKDAINIADILEKNSALQREFIKKI
jgi:effector protein SidC